MGLDPSPPPLLQIVQVLCSYAHTYTLTQLYRFQHINLQTLFTLCIFYVDTLCRATSLASLGSQSSFSRWALGTVLTYKHVAVFIHIYITYTRILLYVSVHSTPTPPAMQPHQRIQVLSLYAHIYIYPHISTFTHIYIKYTRILLYVSVFPTPTPSVVEPHQLLQVLSSHTRMPLHPSTSISYINTRLYHIYTYTFSHFFVFYVDTLCRKAPPASPGIVFIRVHMYTAPMYVALYTDTSISYIHVYLCIYLYMLRRHPLSCLTSLSRYCLYMCTHVYAYVSLYTRTCILCIHVYCSIFQRI